jgi:hypothetical protein
MTDEQTFLELMRKFAVGVEADQHHNHLWWIYVLHNNPTAVGWWFAEDGSFETVMANANE